MADDPVPPKVKGLYAPKFKYQRSVNMRKLNTEKKELKNLNTTQRDHPYFTLKSPVRPVATDLDIQANEEICDIETTDDVRWTGGRRVVELDILASQMTCLYIIALISNKHNIQLIPFFLLTISA